MNYQQRESIIRSVEPSLPDRNTDGICASPACWREVKEDHEYCECCERRIEEQIDIEQYEMENR